MDVRYLIQSNELISVISLASLSVFFLSVFSLSRFSLSRCFLSQPAVLHVGRQQQWVYPLGHHRVHEILFVYEKRTIFCVLLFTHVVAPRLHPLGEQQEPVVARPSGRTSPL